MITALLTLSSATGLPPQKPFDLDAALGKLPPITKEVTDSGGQLRLANHLIRMGRRKVRPLVEAYLWAQPDFGKAGNSPYPYAPTDNWTKLLPVMSLVFESPTGFDLVVPHPGPAAVFSDGIVLIMPVVIDGDADPRQLLGYLSRTNWRGFRTRPLSLRRGVRPAEVQRLLKKHFPIFGAEQFLHTALRQNRIRK